MQIPMYFSVEELERQHQIRLRLGYQPEAAPPDLANVKSRINNKHISSRKYQKSTKGAQNTPRLYPARNLLLLNSIQSRSNLYDIK